MFISNYKIRRICEINKLVFRWLCFFSPPLVLSQTASPSAAVAADSLIYIYTLLLPFERGRAVDYALWLGRVPPSQPMVLSSLTAVGFCGMAWCGGCESGSAIGHGAKRSVAGEAVWSDGVGGLWRCKGWETLGSQTPTKTDMVREADGLTSLDRDGPFPE